jgi:hypothetical protein
MSSQRRVLGEMPTNILSPRKTATKVTKRKMSASTPRGVLGDESDYLESPPLSKKIKPSRSGKARFIPDSDVDSNIDVGEANVHSNFDIEEYDIDSDIDFEELPETAESNELDPANKNDAENPSSAIEIGFLLC